MARPKKTTDAAPDQYHQKKCENCGTWNANRAVACTNCKTPLPLKGKARKVKKPRRMPTPRLTGVEVGNGHAHTIQLLKAAKALGFDKAKEILNEVG